MARRVNLNVTARAVAVADAPLRPGILGRRSTRPGTIGSDTAQYPWSVKRSKSERVTVLAVQREALAAWRRRSDYARLAGCWLTFRVWAISELLGQAQHPQNYRSRSAVLEPPHLDPGAARIVWRDRQRHLGQRAAAAPAAIGVPASGRLRSLGRDCLARVGPEADECFARPAVAELKMPMATYRWPDEASTRRPTRPQSRCVGSGCAYARRRLRGHWRGPWIRRRVRPRSRETAFDSGAQRA
jgi:hypothetical protein